jgi:hypothetical protein
MKAATATPGIEALPDLGPVGDLIERGELWRLEPHTFARHVSGGRWKPWPHLRYVGERVSDAVSRGGGRLIVNMPPGHGKSSFLSKWCSAWLLDNLPHWRIIVGSHGAELASDWGRTVRNEFEQNPLLTTRLREDSKAAHRWNTAHGGGMYATGVGGGITGFRANVVLIDDPHANWEEAKSVTHLRRTSEWFTGTMMDRLEPGGTVLILMHRWDEDDLTGYLVEQSDEQWEVIRLPALAEAGDPLGRQPGQALCPQRFDVPELNQLRIGVTEAVWQPKYQQNPGTVGAGRVYYRFDGVANVDRSLRLRPDLPVDVSFDFNYNPGMHAVVGQYDPAADFFTAVHEVHGPYMRLQDAPGHPGTGCLSVIVRLLEKEGGGAFPWPELRIFGDPSGHQNRAETTHTAWQQVHMRLEPFARRFGKPYRIKVGSAQFPVKSRIDCFNAALRDDGGHVHYKVHPGNCPRLMDDFKRLKPDEFGLIDKSDNKLSHASEAEANRVHWIRPIRPLMPRSTGRVAVA